MGFPHQLLFPVPRLLPVLLSAPRLAAAPAGGWVPALAAPAGITGLRSWQELGLCLHPLVVPVWLTSSSLGGSCSTRCTTRNGRAWSAASPTPWPLSWPCALTWRCATGLANGPSWIAIVLAITWQAATWSTVPAHLLSPARRCHSCRSMCLLQAELECELAEELRSYGLSPGTQGLTDHQFSDAMAELEQRRAEARQTMSPGDRQRFDYMRATVGWHVQRVSRAELVRGPLVASGMGLGGDELQGRDAASLWRVGGLQKEALGPYMTCKTSVHARLCRWRSWQAGSGRRRQSSSRCCPSRRLASNPSVSVWLP